MQEPTTSIFAIVLDTLREHQGVNGPITSTSRICGDLGVCDDDLSELVEELFGRLGYRVSEETTVLPVPQDKLSVAHSGHWAPSLRKTYVQPLQRRK